ncbi:MAG: ABC transporter permease [Candidatus Njordarchaeia archaeon]
MSIVVEKYKKWIMEHETLLREYKASFLALWRNPLTKIGFSLMALMIIVAIFAPFIAPYPVTGFQSINTTERLQPPSWRHLMGTDYVGRDILSRIIFGTRIALLAALVVVSFSLAIGVPLGLIAGYYGGMIDEVIMRITDLFLAFPALLLAMVIAALIGPSLMNALLAIAVTWWPWYTRIVRNTAVSIKERDYVYAAKALGISDWKIILYFILPNSLAPIIVQATIDMGTVILAEAGLAFLGLGSRPGSPDWGLMVYEGSAYILTSWWYSFFPGLAIFIGVLAFNLIGDALREFLDPKLRVKRRI